MSVVVVVSGVAGAWVAGGFSADAGATILATGALVSVVVIIVIVVAGRFSVDTGATISAGALISVFVVVVIIIVAG